PNAYFDTRARSLTLTVSDPVEQEVQIPPCFAQNEQVHARAGISDGSGRQSRANEILPQWQRPEINMALPQQPTPWIWMSDRTDDCPPEVCHFEGRSSCLAWSLFLSRHR